MTIPTESIEVKDVISPRFLPSGGANGQTLIRTQTGAAWADNTNAPFSDERGGVALGSAVNSAGDLFVFPALRRTRVVGISIEYENPIRQLVDVTVTAKLNNRTLDSVVLPRYRAEEELIELWEATTKFWINCDESLYTRDVLTVSVTAGSLGDNSKLRVTAWSKLPENLLADANMGSFRHHRRSGPLSNDSFPTMPTHITRGNGIRYDLLCAPANPSNIIKDPVTGEYVQVTSYWTRDEAFDLSLGNPRVGATCELYWWKGVQATGGSAVNFADNFNRADTEFGDGLFNRLGNGWVSGGSPRGAIQGNRALIAHRSSATVGQAPTDGLYLRPESATDSNIQITISQIYQNAIGGIELAARYTSTNYYLFYFGHDGQAAVFRKLNGAATQLGSTVAFGFVAGDRIEMDVAGGRVQVFLTRGGGARTKIFDQTDSQPLPAGQTGFGAVGVDFAAEDAAVTLSGNAPLFDVNGAPVLAWTPMGKMIARIPKSQSVDDQNIYVGDPKLFIDLDGNACISYNTADGTSDLVDFTKASLKVRRGATFADLVDGGANQTFTVFTRLRTASPFFCGRLVPRPSKNDYLLVFVTLAVAEPTYSGRVTKICQTANYATPLPENKYLNATTVSRNCCEGGNVWRIRDRVFISEWQNMNNQSSGGAMCVSSAPIDSAELDSTVWTQEKGWYHNDPDDARRIGGVSLDAAHYWWDEATDDLWMTACTYATEESTNDSHINYVIWSRAKFADLHRIGKATLGATGNAFFTPVRTGPTIDLPVKTNQTLSAKFKTGLVANGAIFFGIGGEPVNGNLEGNHQVFIIVGVGGTSAFQFGTGSGGVNTVLDLNFKYVPNTNYDLSVKKIGNLLILLNGTTEVGRFDITDQNAIAKLKLHSARWKFLAQSSTRVEFTDITLR